MSEELTPLHWGLGDWIGVRTDGKTGNTFPMTITVRPILGNSGFAEEMEVRHGSKTYHAFAVYSFDTKRGTWVMKYVNDVGGQFVEMQGEINGEDSIWRSIDPKRTREAKLVFERTGTSGWRRTQFASEDGGETWFVVFKDDLNRAS